MLSKEHLRYGVKGSECVPYFLKPTAHWETIAQELITLGQNGMGQSFGELQEQWLACEAASGRYRKAAKGLRSLLERKIELVALDEENLEAERHKAWQTQVARLRQASGPLPFPEQSVNLYADLESRRTVSFAPKWSPIQLIHRYNLALLQGLLLHAERIKCEIPGASPRALRYFWRYLRFFGLLVRVENMSEGKSVHFFIEGPLQDLGATQRYRSRMAAIVGVLPHFEHWKLRADLLIGQERSYLIVDESSGLRSHYQAFYDYIPDELKVFTTSATAELKGWIPQEPLWPSKPLQEWDVPDLVFEHPKGYRLNLFIYFAAQKEAFLRHLQQLQHDTTMERNILFAERSLLKKGDPAPEVIPFSAMPSSRALVKKLKEWGWQY